MLGMLFIREKIDETIGYSWSPGERVANPKIQSFLAADGSLGEESLQYLERYCTALLKVRIAGKSLCNIGPPDASDTNVWGFVQATTSNEGLITKEKLTDTGLKKSSSSLGNREKTRAMKRRRTFKLIYLPSTLKLAPLGFFKYPFPYQLVNPN